MTSPVKRTVAASVAIVLALGVASCGLQEEQQAQVIEEVQYELLGTSTSTTSTTVAQRPSFMVSFFWHTAGGSRLRELERAVAERPTPGQTLTELVVGPTPEDLETNPDLQTQLNETMEPVLTQVDGTTYQIRIQRPAEEQLSVEQATEFVCTATQFDEIDAITIVNAEDIAFTLSGAGAVPIPGPARADDFGGCVEDPPLELDPAEGEGGDDQESGTTTTP